MWKNVCWTETASVVGRAFGGAVLCMAATVFLLYPVLAQLMMTVR